VGDGRLAEAQQGGQQRAATRSSQRWANNNLLGPRTGHGRGTDQGRAVRPGQQYAGAVLPTGAAGAWPFGERPVHACAFSVEYPSVDSFTYTRAPAADGGPRAVAARISTCRLTDVRTTSHGTCVLAERQRLRPVAAPPPRTVLAWSYCAALISSPAVHVRVPEGYCAQRCDCGVARAADPLLAPRPACRSPTRSWARRVPLERKRRRHRPLRRRL